MIRINLIAPPKQTSTRAPIDASQKIALGGSLILLLAAAFVGWSYWSLGQNAAQVAREIEEQRREEARLQQVISEVRDFEARRERLQQRVSLIEELRRGQTAPVHILDQVSLSLPDMVWLTRLTQAGYDITLEGNCLTLTALSDFVGALEHSRYFNRPVEIINSEVVPATGTTPELIKFVIKGGFQMSGLTTPTPPPAPGAATPAGAPAKGGARG
ncbi:MAG: PilN domain-containing protein [Acidobacteriota bacterium]